MTKKNVFHEFDPVIYPLKLWVVMTNSVEIINERFSSYPKGEIEMDFRKFDAGVILAVKKEDKNIGILMVFENAKHFTIETIAHETSHAVREIWKHLKEDYYGDEATAYLSGWIADCCWKVKTGKL